MEARPWARRVQLWEAAAPVRVPAAGQGDDSSHTKCGALVGFLRRWPYKSHQSRAEPVETALRGLQREGGDQMGGLDQLAP